MNALLQRLAGIERQNNLASDYQKTLELLKALKAGELALDQVNMIDGGWSIIAVAATEPPAPPKLAEPTPAAE